MAKAGGGLYWEGDKPDNRDYTIGYDTNDDLKRRLFGDVLQRMKEQGWLSSEYSKRELMDLEKEAFGKENQALLRGAQILSLIEFGRCVHAEMAAITDAARRGVSVGGSVLYTTTFPCHECARNIVSAGISRVVYIEPYPKSLVPELYPDSVAIETSRPGRVCFDLFLTVYSSIFLQNRGLRNHRGGVAPGAVSPPGADGSTC